MTNAYSEMSLEDAMRNLGESFDYASNDCHIDIDEYFNLFIVSGYSLLFESRHPSIVSGLSGAEIVLNILKKTKNNKDYILPKETYSISKEYWAGWVLAYFQWKTRRTFKEIHQYISIKEIIKMYNPYHEASEDKFVDVLNKIIKNKEQCSKLQSQRKKCGLSQNELAKKSGVNLRTLQQYEIKAKDINKASVNYVLSLANALNCDIKDILEY